MVCGGVSATNCSWYSAFARSFCSTCFSKRLRIPSTNQPLCSPSPRPISSAVACSSSAAIQEAPNISPKNTEECDNSPDCSGAVIPCVTARVLGNDRSTGYAGEFGDNVTDVSNAVRVDAPGDADGNGFRPCEAHSADCLFSSARSLQELRLSSWSAA